MRGFLSALVLTVTIVILSIPVEAKYKMKAYNCLKPEGMKKFKRDSMCKINEPKAAAKPFVVAQRTRTTDFDGYSCELKVSELHFKCGVWSHLKLGGVPKILHTEEVSISWCKTMVTRRKFKLDMRSESFSIQMNRVNIFPVITIGSLREEADRIVCTGEDVHYKNALHTNLVVLKEYQLIVKQETFRTDFSTIEVTSQHEQLPCPLGTGGCTTGRKTYVYQPPKEECKLQKVKNIKARKIMKSYWIDQTEGVILNDTGITRITGCKFEVTKTQFEDLFLVDFRHANNMAPLQRNQLEIDLETRMNVEMNQYRREEMEKKIKRSKDKTTCDQIKQGTAHKPIQVGAENFVVTAGDLVYQFTCPEIEVEILETNVCYQDIPVMGDKVKFVDQETRVLKQHSPTRPCSTHFPVTIKTQAGWVEINPHIRGTKEPMDYVTRADQPSAHLDMSKTGLYTEAELKSWEQIISFPSYQEALLSEVTWGICVHQKDCEATETVQQYDVSKLYPEIMGELSLWEMLKKKVRKYGDTLALIVILYVSIKIMVDILFIVITLIREGPHAVLALVISLYLSNQQKYQRIRRRNRRMKQQDRKKEDRMNGPEAEEAEAIV